MNKKFVILVTSKEFGFLGFIKSVNYVRYKFSLTTNEKVAKQRYATEADVHREIEYLMHIVSANGWDYIFTYREVQ